MYLKKHKKSSVKLNLFAIIFLLILVSLIYLLNLFNDKALPQLLSYSEIETKKIVTAVINGSVLEQSYKNKSIDSLFIITKDSNDISYIDFDSNVVNGILVDTYNSVEQNLEYLESGQVDKLKLNNINLSKYNNDKLKDGIIYEIPSGIILNNALFNNVLPKIPVKINLTGSMLCRIDTDVKSYGINNALITVNVIVEVEVKILLPFVSETTKITESIPILIKIIEGNIPSYYFDKYLPSQYVG